jgi:hypothetical protein
MLQSLGHRLTDLTDIDGPRFSCLFKDPTVHPIIRERVKFCRPQSGSVSGIRPVVSLMFSPVRARALHTRNRRAAPTGPQTDAAPSPGARFGRRPPRRSPWARPSRCVRGEALSPRRRCRTGPSQPSADGSRGYQEPVSEALSVFGCAPHAAVAVGRARRERRGADWHLAPADRVEGRRRRHPDVEDMHDGVVTLLPCAIAVMQESQVTVVMVTQEKMRAVAAPSPEELVTVTSDLLESLR